MKPANRVCDCTRGIPRARAPGSHGAPLDCEGLADFAPALLLKSAIAPVTRIPAIRNFSVVSFMGVRGPGFAHRSKTRPAAAAATPPTMLETSGPICEA